MPRVKPRPQPANMALLLTEDASDIAKVVKCDYDLMGWLVRLVGQKQLANLNLGRTRHVLYAPSEEADNVRATAMTTALGATVKVQGPAVFYGVTVDEVLTMLRGSKTIGTIE